MRISNSTKDNFYLIFVFTPLTMLETIRTYPLSYQICLGLWFFLSVALIPLLRYVTAPFGRHTRPGWGPTIDNRLGWFIMESPAIYVSGYWFWKGPNHDNTVLLVCWLLYVGHYFYRSVIYPLMERGRRRMPLVITASAISFNLINGYLIGFFLGHLAVSADYSSFWFTDYRFFLGLALFLTGFVLNIQSDAILRALRKPGETGYKIPQEGLHKLVASPNYLTELVEWIGFAILTWSIAGVAFAAFTAGNLIPRALSHLVWYRKTFPDYPKERKAIFPYLL
jgi:3-oxo-5-alpha-steroid 4-dehydrogenase 1